MGNIGKNYTAYLDTRNRVMVPKPLIDAIKIHRCVEFELKKDGILMKSFDPKTLEHCALCPATAPTLLIKIGNDEYLCPTCARRVEKVVAGCRPKE